MFSQKGYGIMIKNGVPVTVETGSAEPSSEGKAGKKGAVRKKRNSTQAAQTKQSAQETQ